MNELRRAGPPGAQQQVHSPLSISRRLLANSIQLTDQALMNGMRVVGGPGAGKSRWAGRALVWQKLIRGHPLIVLDPTGSISANVFDKLCRQRGEIQEVLWPRIKYVDMAARDHVIPLPLYFRRDETDTLLAVANRFLEVLRRLDPYLQTASVEGWNAVYEVGTAAGMMVAALDMQITEVADMIRRPKDWKPQLEAAWRAYPDELQLAYDYFQAFMEIKNPAHRSRRVGSFLIKLIPFLADPTMKALFAASRPGIDLDREMQQGHAVIYDFQDEHDPVRRRLKLLWCFLNHVEYVKARGSSGRENPILYVVDEITQLTGQHAMDHTLMADDINELTTVLARNYALNLCILGQNLSQIDERTQVSLGQLGTQIIGWVQEPADCLKLAEQFFHYDPQMVRKWEPVWMNVQKAVGPLSYSEPEVIDTTTTEYTLEEQLYLLADRFRTLGRFRFLVRTATAEGTLSPHLRPMNIEGLDRGCYPDTAQVSEVRRRLRKRDGVALSTLLAEIRRRRDRPVTIAQQPERERDILDEDHGGTTHDDASAGSPISEPKPIFDDFWEEVS